MTVGMTHKEVSSMTQTVVQHPPVRVDAKVLEEAFAPFKIYGDEITVQPAEPDGWTVAAMDGSKISLLSVTVPGTSFAENPEWPVFTVKLDDILPALRHRGTLTLTLSDGSLTVSSEDGGEREMPLLGDADPTPFPPLTPCTSVTLPADTLRGFVTEAAAAKMAVVRLTLEDDRFTMAAREDRRRIALTPADVPSVGEAVARYPIANLQELMRAVKTPSVTLEWDTDYPLIVTFGEGYTGRYMLAPWIAEDDTDW